MSYPQLIEKCAKAIKDGRCLGCVNLENPTFAGNPNCEYSKTPTAEESIREIHRILGIGEQMKI